jgi:hypothetical protein
VPLTLACSPAIPFDAERAATVEFTVTGTGPVGPVTAVSLGGHASVITSSTSSGNVATVRVTVPAELGEGTQSVQAYIGSVSCTRSAAINVLAPPKAWRTPFNVGVNLLGTVDTGSYPVLAMTPGGHALAVWSQTLGGFSVLWASFYQPGSGWGPKTLLSDRETSLAFPAAVCLNEAGEAVIVAQTGAVTAWTYAPASGWSAPTSLETAIGAGSVALALNGDGQAVALWTGRDPHWQAGSSNLSIRSAVFAKGTGWRAAMALLPPSSQAGGMLSRAFLAANGKVLVCWNQLDPANPSPYLNQTLWVGQYDWLSGWEPAEQVGGPTCMPVDWNAAPQITGDGHGRRLLIWAGGVDMDHLTLRSMRFIPGQGWAALTAPSPDTTIGSGIAQSVDLFWHVGLLSLDMNSSGQAVLGWNSNRGAHVRLFDPGSGWSLDHDLVGPASVGGNGCPTVAINGGGDVAAAWIGFSRITGFGGYFSDAVATIKPAGGAWQTPQRIDRTDIPAYDTRGVRVAMDDLGRCLFAGPADDTDDIVKDAGGLTYNTFEGTAGFGACRLLANRAFGQATRPWLDLNPDGRFLVSWEQTERRLKTPWGVSLPAPSQNAALTENDIRKWLGRPFSADFYPAGDATSPLVTRSSNDFGNFRPAAAWLELSGGHRRLCANDGTDGASWGNASKDPNPAGLDADQLQIAALATQTTPAPLIFGIFRKTAADGGHGLWSYSTPTGYHALTTAPLSAAGPEITGACLATNGKTAAQAIWQQAGSGGWELWTADFTLAERQWSAPRRLPGTQAGATAPQAGVTATEHRMAAWLVGDSGTELWTMLKGPASEWGLATPLAQPGKAITSVDIASNGDGSFAIAWCQGEASDREAWGRVYQQGVGWGDPIKLSWTGIPVSQVKAGMASGGQPAFAWLAGTGTALEVYAASWNAKTGWPAATRLSDGQGRCGDLAMKVAPAGHALAVWSQIHGAFSEIWGCYFY